MLVIKFKSQQGGILITYLFIILFLGLFWLTAAILISSEMKSQINYMDDRKAFYAAESGLELAIGDLNNGGDGNLNDIIIDGITINTNNEGDSIITIIAKTNVTAKKLQVKIEKIDLPEAFYYAVSSFKPNAKLKFNGKHAPFVSGNIFSYAGEVEFEKDYVIDEGTTLIVPEGTEVENETSYNININYFPAGTTPVEWPELDTRYYDDYIDNVEGYAEYPEHEIRHDLDLNTLPHGVLYVSDKNLKIKKGVKITGPGVIVSRKKIQIEKDVSIGPNVHIIADKDLDVKEGVNITGMGSILYSSTKVKIKHENNAIYGSIISPKRVEIDPQKELEKRGVIYGIVYCGTGGKAKIRHATIYGSIVAYEYEKDEIHCTYIVFDDSYLPPTAPPGLQTVSSKGISVRKGSWKILN